MEKGLTCGKEVTNEETDLSVEREIDSDGN